MNKKIPYELELEIKEQFIRFCEFEKHNYDYSLVFRELCDEVELCFECNCFSKLKICLSRMKLELNRDISPDCHYRNDFALKIIEEIELFSDKMIDAGVDCKDDELTEKEELRKIKQKSDLKLKEIQEENCPYLNLSLSIVFILMAIIFLAVPNYFHNVIVLYHICGLMFFLGFVCLKNELQLRAIIGFISKSSKITNKRAAITLIQSLVYMLPLATLSFFFYDLMFIRILLYFQILFCAVLFINGISILIASLHINKKMEKWTIWSFISGAITIIGFVIQILQLFDVL